MKKGFILLFSFIVVLTPYSCEDFKLIVDCDKCFTDLSDKYNIEYKVTLDNVNRAIPVTLYKGNIDDGIIISRDTVHSQPYYSELVDFGNQ